MAEQSAAPSVFVSGPRLIDGSNLNAAFGQPQCSVTSGATASGTTIADALEFLTAILQLATVAANTGVKLNPKLVPGQKQTVYNDGASPLTVYWAGGTIDGTAGSVGVTLTNALRCEYTCVAPGVVVSAQLGVVSA